MAVMSGPKEPWMKAQHSSSNSFTVTIPLLTHPLTKGKGTEDNKESGRESNHVSQSGSNVLPEVSRSVDGFKAI
jgi:hypothetical protein